MGAAHTPPANQIRAGAPATDKNRRSAYRAAAARRQHAADAAPTKAAAKPTLPTERPTSPSGAQGGGCVVPTRAPRPHPRPAIISPRSLHPASREAQGRSPEHVNAQPPNVGAPHAPTTWGVGCAPLLGGRADKKCPNRSPLIAPYALKPRCSCDVGSRTAWGLNAWWAIWGSFATRQWSGVVAGV